MIDLDNASTIEAFLDAPDQFVKMLDDSDKFIKNILEDVIVYCADIGLHIIGYKDGKITGMSIMRAVNDPHNDNIKIIKVEYVTLPAYRRQGYAHDLTAMGIKFMAQWGIKMGKPFDMVEADVEPDNKASAAVAKSLGLHHQRQYECDGKKYLVYADIIEYSGDDFK